LGSGDIATQELVPYDAVNRNKVAIRQLPLFYFFYFYLLHVSAPTGHPQMRYTIDVSKELHAPAALVLMAITASAKRQICSCA
jgi:hypothetical protein